jgi:DNA-binding MarR family transcriptional regulator
MTTSLSTGRRQADAVRAWRAIRRLAHDPDTLAELRRRGEAKGVTPSVAKALVHLAGEPPEAMRSLAEALRCDSSYVTAVVDHLEQQGLAERRPHPTDRRVKVVVLTEAGRHKAAEIAAVVDQPPPAFGQLSAEELHQLVGLLEKLLGDPIGER